MKATDMKIGTRVSYSDWTGTVIANVLRSGDEVVAVEWDNGAIMSANVNDLILDMPSLENYTRFQPRATRGTLSHKRLNKGKKR